MEVLASILQVLSNGLEPFWKQFFIAILLFYILAAILTSGWIVNNLARFKKKFPCTGQGNQKEGLQR